MKKSLVSFSPLVSFSSLHSRKAFHGVWLKSRLCAYPRLSTLSLGSLHQPLRLLQRPHTAAHEQSIWKFVSDRVLRATHRSGINRRSRVGYNPGGRGPQGPWQRFKDQINAIPSNFIFWGIIGLNGIVFASWNFAWAKYQSMGDPSSYVWMREHFVAGLDNIRSGRWYTLLTCCFSHEDTMHLLFNGFTFYFMAPLVLSILGNVGFLSLYLGGGIVSSLASITWRSYNQPRMQPDSFGSHGASGAIYSVISFFACIAPNASFYLFGVLPLPAWAVVTGVFLWDGYNTLTNQPHKTDTVGHIGGLLAGIGYFIAKRFRVF